MKEIDNEGRTGKFILLYGDTGVGKSTSCIESLPEPVVCIYTEPRSPTVTLSAIERKVDVKFICPENYEDLHNWLAEEAKKDTVEYKSLVFDSLSYFMNVALKQDVEDETSEAEIFKKKRALTDSVKVDMEAWGAMSSLMKRVCKLLGIISRKGVVVVGIALLQENPKWNRELSAAPAFGGKDFPLNAPAYFDAIGLVEQRVDEHGNVIYPPKVSFEGDGFVSKWSGSRKKRPVGPLNFEKILKIV